jgi:hypothetical protein
MIVGMFHVSAELTAVGGRPTAENEMPAIKEVTSTHKNEI